MRASFALEGFEPDADDLANQQMYIDGKNQPGRHVEVCAGLRKFPRVGQTNVTMAAVRPADLVAEKVSSYSKRIAGWK